MPFGLPPVTRALLIANVAVYLLQLATGDLLILPFALWPLGPDVSGIGFRPWQILSYGFLHGNLLHLGMNMFALYMFGAPVERLFGTQRFGLYYLVSVAGAALTQLVVVALFQQGFYPTIGASGGVFGLLLAFGLLFPEARVMSLFLPIPLPARQFVVLFGALELFLGVTGTQAGVAHFAHLGGMLGGYLLIRYWRGRTPWRPDRWR